MQLNTSIPNHELDLLSITLDDAAEAAGDGRISEAYADLQGALYRTEEFLESGEPWAPELRARYEEAVETFVRMYGCPKS